MDPIEINAGTYYLRQLRADDLLDDSDTLRANGFPDPLAHIAARAHAWHADTGYAWAIAEPATGALLGEAGLVDVRDGTARAICWIAPEHRERGVASTALASVVRFGVGALELHTIEWTHPAGDAAAEGVARTLGWTLTGESAGRLRWHVTG